MKVKAAQSGPTFRTPWTIQSMEFSRSEYWSVPRILGSLSLLQGIFPTQGSNPGLLHCRQILYSLSCQGSSFPISSVAAPNDKASVLKKSISFPGSLTPSSRNTSDLKEWHASFTDMKHRKYNLNVSMSTHTHTVPHTQNEATGAVLLPAYLSQGDLDIPVLYRMFHLNH